MLAFLQAYSPPAFHASACAPRVLRVSIRLMQSDGAILITKQFIFFETAFLHEKTVKKSFKKIF
jgi:hypothetical protein